jgi:hypothetical protein
MRRVASGAAAHDAIPELPAGHAVAQRGDLSGELTAGTRGVAGAHLGPPDQLTAIGAGRPDGHEDLAGAGGRHGSLA